MAAASPLARHCMCCRNYARDQWYIVGIKSMILYFVSIAQRLTCCTNDRVMVDVIFVSAILDIMYFKFGGVKCIYLYISLVQAQEQ
jgi:hypothetical protein